MPRKNRGKHHEDFKLKDLILSPVTSNMACGNDDRNREDSMLRSDVEGRLP